jgi:hypothetical protein
MRNAVEEAPAGAHGPALPAAPARQLAPGHEAAALVLAPVAHDEGAQVGVLGDTGAGKTTAAVEVVKTYVRMSRGVALIIDDKERLPRYPGTCRASPDDLRAHPITPEERDRHGRIIVFRGNMLAGEDADPEAVAALAWDFARLSPPRPTLVVHDELNRPELAKNMQWRSGVKWVPASFTKGRAVGVGNLWSSQSPQDAPIAVFEQTSAILCFKLGGMGLEKLRQRGYLDGGAERVIPTLHAMESAPAQRGDFVVLRRGQPWNGKVYKFSVS